MIRLGTMCYLVRVHHDYIGRVVQVVGDLAEYKTKAWPGGVQCYPVRAEWIDAVVSNKLLVVARPNQLIPINDPDRTVTEKWSEPKKVKLGTTKDLMYIKE